MWYIIGGNLLIIVIAFIVVRAKIKKFKEYLKQNYISSEQEKLQKEIDDGLASLRLEKKQLEQSVLDKQQEEVRIDKEIRRANEILNNQLNRATVYENDLRARAEKMAKTYEEDLIQIANTREKIRKESEEREAENRKKLLDHELKVRREQQEKEWSEQFEEKKRISETTFAESMTAQAAAAAEIQQSIDEMVKVLNEYAIKQATINEAIMRQRAIEEQQDFYRICLDENAKADISLLQSIRQNLKKPEIVDKIIYDNYIAKPVLEMIKRVLNNETFSGIYKITCVSTQEVYIGKSTDIKSRWQQHAKTAFNCGTIASSLLHTKMKKHGIENFTFELLEKVPKENLSEREKFYIDFYQTKEVGLNERKG